MSTAIVEAFTEQGFVIAADGRQLKNDKPFNDTLQKIFPISEGRTSLAYALCGAHLLTSDDTNEPVWDLAAEMKQGIKSLLVRKSQNLLEYAQRLSMPINRHLEQAKKSGAVTEYPTQGMIDDNTSRIVVVLIDGYYNGVPSRVSVTFCHRNQTLAKPEVVRESLTRGGYIIHGSRAVKESFFSSDDMAFANYAKPTGMGERLTLAEATQVAGEYIRACSSPEALQMDARCAEIGGHIHIASITRRHGFNWVQGYEPA